jgi:hypothetical protein
MNTTLGLRVAKPGVAAVTRAGKTREVARTGSTSSHFTPRKFHFLKSMALSLYISS